MNGKVFGALVAGAVLALSAGAARAADEGGQGLLSQVLRRKRQGTYRYVRRQQGRGAEVREGLHRRRRCVDHRRRSEEAEALIVPAPPGDARRRRRRRCPSESASGRATSAIWSTRVRRSIGWRSSPRTSWPSAAARGRCCCGSAPTIRWSCTASACRSPATEPLDPDHLERLRALADEVEPRFVTDHLAWTSWRGRESHDLLPVAYTEAVLAHVARRVDAVQERWAGASTSRIPPSTSPSPATR